MSTTSAHTFKASYDVVYTLKETSAPFGYYTADDITFYVDSADDTLKILQADGVTYAAAAGNTVTMVDTLKGTHAFTVDKQSAEQGISLAGAALKISEHADGSHPVLSWTSTGTPESVTLPTGEYYLVETSAPRGYLAATPMRFRFDASGRLSVWNAAISGFEEKDDFALVMKDAADPADTVSIDMNEQDIYNTMLSGIGMKLYRFSADRSSTTLLDTWTTDGTHHNMMLQYQTLYLLTESTGLAGYLPTQSVVFKISNDGNVMTENTDGSFTDSGDNKAILTARQIPPASSGGSSHHHHHSGASDSDDAGISAGTNAPGSVEGFDPQNPAFVTYGTAVGPDGQMINLVDGIHSDGNAADDGNTQRVSGMHLAKTGGFMGTPMSYAAGILSILAGLFLLFRKKKCISEEN